MRGVNSKKLDRFCSFSKVLLFIKRPKFLKFTPCAELVKLSLCELKAYRSGLRRNLTLMVSPFLRSFLLRYGHFSVDMVISPCVDMVISPYVDMVISPYVDMVISQ